MVKEMHRDLSGTVRSPPISMGKTKYNACSEFPKNSFEYSEAAHNFGGRLNGVI